jgi:glycosyltransferase involved in cell wall biosynthesis
MRSFPGRLAVQQRVLPSYRVPFFDGLAAACRGGLSLFTGQARANESIASGSLQIAKFAAARSIHLFSGPLYVCYQRGLVDWLADWDPDALIVEANPRYLSTPAAVRWMHRRRRPVIGWGLGAPAFSGSLRRLRRQQWGNFVHQFDGLIAYSQRGAEEYRRLGFPAEKVFVAHNAVSPKPAAAPDRGPLTADRARLLFVGRLQARKRIDALLRICAALPEKPHLTIVGEGPERPNLERIARQVYPTAQFAGARQGDELTPYFTKADLFVLPGTGGLAVQQAMSYGLPVIVAKGDGTQDDLVRQENGWQIPAGDDGALLATLNEALSDMSRLRKMGESSFRIVEQEINLEKMTEAFLLALNSVQAG